MYVIWNTRVGVLTVDIHRLGIGVMVIHSAPTLCHQKHVGVMPATRSTPKNTLQLMVIYSVVGINLVEH